MTKKLKVLYVRMEDEIHNRMAAASEDEGRTMAEIVRRALAEYLNKYHPVQVASKRGEPK